MSLVITASALGMAAALIHREFVPSRAATAADEPPHYYEEWPAIAKEGIRVGNPSARIKIIEFLDLECPACRGYAGTIHEIEQKYRTDVQVLYVHYPLQGHRFARIAARAAECAQTQGRYSEFQSAVFSQQDSLGLKSFVNYARDAGVPDTLAFARCTADTVPIARIDSGVAFGKRIHLTGTPSLMVNGWLFSPAPGPDVLVRTIDKLRAGKRPF
jgi:protein-disulfide isomerase